MLEDGRHRASERGTPQSGIISLLLANIYLHFTLGLRFEKRVKRNGRAYARLIRCADDYVACFQNVDDARHFVQAMEERLNQFHLEVAPEKTRLLEYGQFAQSKAKSRGKRTATFDFRG